MRRQFNLLAATASLVLASSFLISSGSMAQQGSAPLCRSVISTAHGVNHQTSTASKAYGLQDYPLKPESLKVLSQSGVFYVKDTQGRGLVIRFASEDANPHFEALVADYMQKFIGERALPIEMANEQNRNLVLQKVKARWTDRYEYILNDAVIFWNQDKTLSTLPTSITPYVPGLMGIEYFKKIGFSELPIEILRLAGESKYNHHLAPAKVQLELEALWKNWSKIPNPQRVKLQSELSNLLGLPELWNFQTFQQYFETLREMDMEKQERYLAAVLSPIPLQVQQQLAEIWALYTVFGITDLHAGNWILDDQGQVIPIDAAFLQASNSMEHRDFDMGMQQHPYGIQLSFRSLNLYMLRSLPRDFMMKLKRHGRAELLRSSQSFPVRAVTKDVLESFLDRLDSLAKSR